MRYLLLSILTLVTCSTAFASSNEFIAIIGGQSSAPYAALLRADGTLMTVAGLPPTGLTFRVAMNQAGYSLIGGTSGVNAYSGFVTPQGILIPTGGLAANAEIYSVALNDSNQGIVGGGSFSLNIPYAALVSLDGSSQAIAGLPANGLIYGVAINSLGNAIIGGKGTANSAYAALVSPTGGLTPIAGLPTTGGIFWVAINESNLKFMGGQDTASIYAAFLTPDNVLAPIAGLPLGNGYSVGLNASGSAILGGQSLNLPYAALISPEGVVNTLTGLPTTPGIIYNVAINPSGAGLIAGFSATGPYGSFVTPSGVLTPLVGLPVGNGFLDGAALDPSGVAIVGGEFNGAPFAALAAPNGTLTFLTGLPATGAINTIALSALGSLVPGSIGTFNSFANIQYALSDTLSQHCLFIYDPSLCCCEQRPVPSVWGAVFGNYTHERANRSIPSFSNQIGGILAGYDFRQIKDVVIGAGVAYTFNYVDYSQHLGHAVINQESLVLYATWDKPCFYVNAALWAGLFQTAHTRRSLTFITSKANPSGWNLSPHLELGRPYHWNTFIIDPFIAFDWVNNWQSHFREHGASGFNLVLNDHYVSVLRSELGVRFFETLRCNWGDVTMEEKLSYVNKAPFNHNNVAAFIGSISSFGVEVVNPDIQNQGSAQIHIECLPRACRDLYGSLDYQAGFSPSFQSHMLTFAIGRVF